MKNTNWNDIIKLVENIKHGGSPNEIKRDNKKTYESTINIESERFSMY